MHDDNDLPAALIVTRRPYRELSDGTLRVQIDVEPTSKRAFLAMFPDHGDPMVVAKISDEAQLKALREGMAKPSFGDDSRVLAQSSFFRAPEVWRAVGSDDAFRAWIRTQPCAADLSCMPPEYKGHRGDVVAAHVLRIANGAGKGIKPDYSCVPLCDFHHRLQHSQGESAIGGKEYLDRQRIRHVQNWCWQAVKDQLGVASMTEVDPARLCEWAAERGVLEVLPRAYREAGAH